MATVDYWLQDKLNSDLRKKIRDYIEEQIFEPYLERINNPEKQWAWMTSNHNWNTVCHGGVIGAALTLIEDREKRARFIAAGELAIPFYMNGFTDDGFCPENVSYWIYGFSHLLVLNEIVGINTSGKIDFLAGEKVARVTLFPTRVEILNGIYPSYSSIGVYYQPSGWVKPYAEKKMEISEVSLSSLMYQSLGNFRDLYFLGMLMLRDVPISASSGQFFQRGYNTPIRDYFPDGGFLVVRPLRKDPQGMAVSIKAGHNGWNHNHNDLGTFEVVLASEKMIIDPGREIYGRLSRGATHYQTELVNSFGHSVPVVDGQLQSHGRNAEATLMEKEFSLVKDYIKYDMTSAYEVETLEKLTRAFTYERGETSELIVVDEVTFTKPGTFETALIVDTYDQAIENRLSCQWELTGENHWLIKKGNRAIQITVTSPGHEIMMKEKALEAHRMPEGYHPIRLGFSLKEKVKSAQVIMKITPVF